MTLMWIIFIIAIIAVAIYLYFKNKKSIHNSNDIPSINITTSFRSYADGVEQLPKTYEKKIPTLKIFQANSTYNRDKILKSFIRNCNDNYYFKVLPTEDQCIKIFEALEEKNYLYSYILQDTSNSVLDQFREIFPNITYSKIEIERTGSLESFIEYWTDADEDDFKKLPNNKMCIEVFELLENIGISYSEIANNDLLVLNKFRELHPSITYTELEKEIREELELFLDNWSTWNGALEDFKSQLLKKPTQKQMKDIFNALILDGFKPTDIDYNEDAVFNKLITLFPELKK